MTLSGIRGGRAVGHFRISNLTDRPALYSLKTDEFKKNEFAKHVRFREVGDLELKGGAIVSDPIFNLPNGSVLRIPSKSTVMVWVDVNLETFKPGVYKALLRLVPGYSKFEEKHLELNLTVGKVDVRKVNMPTWTYSTRWARDIRELKDCRFNVINMIEFQFGPKPRPDGSRDWSLFDDAVNAMVENGIPLGEIRLLVYPSHPELAVKGSWTPEKMRAELKRLRSLGVEPIPKLNFSACHDQWLKDYSFMLSTDEYYRVVADLIKDVAEIFDHPRFFHLGWDEEKEKTQRKTPYMVIRQGDLWWHDMIYTAKEAERHGARGWIWSDKEWKSKDEFMAKCPRSIVQSHWYYSNGFGPEWEKRNDKKMNAARHRSRFVCGQAAGAFHGARHVEFCLFLV